MLFILHQISTWKCCYAFVDTYGPCLYKLFFPGKKNKAKDKSIMALLMAFISVLCYVQI